MNEINIIKKQFLKKSDKILFFISGLIEPSRNSTYWNFNEDKELSSFLNNNIYNELIYIYINNITCVYSLINELYEYIKTYINFKIDIIAHSLGGLIIINLTNLLPINKLFLLEPTYYYSIPYLKYENLNCIIDYLENNTIKINNNINYKILLNNNYKSYLFEKKNCIIDKSLKHNLHNSNIKISNYFSTF